MEERKEIIAVDFDGTLCEDKWPHIGAPNFKLIKALKNLKEEGARLILWTNRVDDKLEAAVNWCKEKGLEFDAVNDNLPEIIEKFGGNCRKIFADCYIDDKSDRRFDLPYSESKLGWAETEVALACKRERGDSGSEDGDWDYGCACYESALKAYHSLCADGHSGFSIGLTKQILVRLIEGKPLTPIEDTDDAWNDISHYSDDKPGTKFQCKRMSALFKDVEEDGTVKYTDIDQYYCVDICTGHSYRSNIVGEMLKDVIAPITMPYIPQDKPYVIYCEDFTIDEEKRINALGIFYMKDPRGNIVSLNRFFKEAEGENGWIRISSEEYDQYKAEVEKSDNIIGSNEKTV